MLKTRLYFFYSVLLIVLQSTAASFQSNPCIDSTISLLQNQLYNKAHTYLESVLKNDPDNIHAHFMRLYCMQMMLTDYESYVISGERFCEAADSVVSLVEASAGESNSKHSVQCRFYIGYIYGAKGLVHAKQGNWLEAFADARHSYKIMNNVKESDPSFFQADHGIGIYEYYIGQSLRWLPFTKGRTERGIETIQTAAVRDTTPFRYAAVHSLLWILIDEHAYGKADSIVDRALEEFPDNTLFLRIKSRIAFSTGQFNEAITYAEKLADLSEKRMPVNWSDLLSAYDIIITSLDNIGEKTLSRQTAEAVLNFKIPASALKISYVRQHRANIEKLYQRNSKDSKS